MKKPPKNVHLVSYIKPERYQLSLKPDLDAFVFEGEETISLTLDEKVKKITIHSVDLEIESAVVAQNKVKTFATKISYDKKSETATFMFPKSVDAGKAKLTLVFRGILNDKMHGFYRSRYEIAGKEYHMATTQFEATDARRAFPCFDEPAVKAVFDIKIIVPKKSTAISNTMPIAIREHSAGYQVVEFSPTPKMSTYLVAFIVGDLEHIEKKTKEGVLVRVFTTPGKKHQAEFALDCAVKTLSFFTKYFDIPYPMPVLDMVAIPDFASGAMENWGVVTYREEALLIDSNNSSASAKQWVAVVVAHELSHQWFGNLVTMEWWTHLWLNEGFASYIEYLAVDHMFPDWEMWTEFVSNDLGNALSLDSLKHTHPIEVEVHHPDEISEIFDAVSYSKGASVIRMLAEYLGEKDFRDGLRYYLKKYSYQNTETKHLWEALEKVSKKPITKMMSAWTGKAGHPVLDVTRASSKLEIRQSRFFRSPISKKESKDKTLWHVPVSIIGEEHTGKEKFMLNKKNERIKTAFGGGWIKINAGESSVFRVNYTPALWELLSASVSKKELSPVDRLGLVRDSFDLAMSGDLDTPTALDFASAYKNETNFAVWSELATGLGMVDNLVGEETFASSYKKYCRDIFAPMVKKVGWKKKPCDGHSGVLLRGLVLANAGKYGDESVVVKSRKLFDSIKKGRNPIPADLRGVVYTVVARYGDKNIHEKLMAMHLEATLHEEKNRIGRALGRFAQKELLEKTLNFSLSKKVRAQDTMLFVGTVLSNPKGRDLAWRFVKKQWPVFLERYGGGKSLSGLVSSLGSFLHEGDAVQIETFFKKNPAPGATRTVEQTLESIRTKASWLSRDKKKLTQWINAIQG
ncbi:MAG: M1 family metallopeptidase [Candidatus Yonathbacteria bacterium]|nr:M1 family metallopeptidase [Candidatus Yonathbacteria bacterium]